MSRVLIVEDELHLAKGLRYNLEAEGHTVQVVGDGESALELLLPTSSSDKTKSLNGQPTFDAIVLDVMLPGKDGFAVAGELRAAQNFIPILMLTARGRSEDVLKGFASGTDDYLPKPFELPILLARLQSLLRRRAWSKIEEPISIASTPPSLTSTPERAEFTFDGRTIDFEKLELRFHGKIVQLTLMEGDLFRHLIRNSGRIVSRKQMLEDVWDLRDDTDTRAIDNFIVRLRRYIEDDPSQPKYLQTVRGVGYRFVPQPET